MKISGDNQKADYIILTHKGMDVRFAYIPTNSLYHNQLQSYVKDRIEKDKKVEITFEDLKEVEELIFMLHRFKEEYCTFGKWKMDFSSERGQL